MSVSYFVRYDIEAADLPAFIRRYREVHVPLVARWPGLRRMVLHTPLAWRAAMNAALASRERAQAREDFKKFPPYEGTVVHPAMAQEEVYRK